MSAYTIINGDTFESISRKQYGTEQESGRIARANPGVREPLTAGTSIIIPTLPDAPQNSPQSAPANKINEVAVLIDGARFRFWNSIQISQSIDSIDSVSFGAPFDSNAPDFRDIFRPFSFKPLTVTVGGVPLFTGTMVAVDPSLDNSQKTVSISGYSLPGVLNDCMFLASSYPVEYNNLNLLKIATAAADTFGINVDFEGDPGPAFERVNPGPTTKVLSFLTDLAAQRNFVISSSPSGALRFLRSIEPGRPVAVLQQGASPVLSVVPTFGPQSYYSHITGIVPTVVGVAGDQFTTKNPLLPDVVRPFSFKAEDTTNADVKASVDAKIGRMFGNMASYQLSVSTWRDPSGALWAPNTTISLQAPDAMVYSQYEFIVRSVDFERSSDSETATLTLVLPGAFSGKIPEALPWDS